MIVLDASVAVKWFIEETGSAAALALLDQHSNAIVAPDLFGVEVAAAFVRRANMHKDESDLLREAVADFAAMLERSMVLLPGTTPAQVAVAADLAIDLGHPLKDCLYLALAIEIGCQLWTADAKFAAKALVIYPDVTVLGE